MTVDDRSARRYHWLSDHIKSFVVESHDAVVGDLVREKVLDMTAAGSEGSRRVSVDLDNDGPDWVKRILEAMRP